MATNCGLEQQTFYFCHSMGQCRWFSVVTWQLSWDSAVHNALSIYLSSQDGEGTLAGALAEMVYLLDLELTLQQTSLCSYTWWSQGSQEVEERAGTSAYIIMLLSYWPKLVTQQSAVIWVVTKVREYCSTLAHSAGSLSADVPPTQWLRRTEWRGRWGTPLSLLFGLAHFLLHQRPAGWPQTEPP